MKNIQHPVDASIPVDIVPFISLQNNAWVFKVWESVPGPGEDDFICNYTSCQEAVTAATTYLYGEPTIIDAWVISLHHHPELNLGGIQNALAHGVNVSQCAFEGIAERRRERIERYYWHHQINTSRWEKALQWQFLSIVHSTNPSILLRLRRDMQETYIVHLDNF